MVQLAAANPTPARVDINMTPLIDVVFQLLTFFLMTFRTASSEGDFALKLPRDGGERSGGNPIDRITLRLTARSNGDLEALQMDNRPPIADRDAYRRLHDEVVRLANIARSAGQSELEVVIDAADGLRYEHVIQAVEAVSARVDEHGEIVPLIRKVRFTPQ